MALVIGPSGLRITKISAAYFVQAAHRPSKLITLSSKLRSYDAPHAPISTSYT